MPQGFANLEGLMRLSRSEGVDIRQALLRVLTDLYVQAASQPREKEQQFVELAMRLIPEVDANTRLAVAQKLGAYPLAPPVLLGLLAPELAQIARTARPAPGPIEAPAKPAREAPGALRPLAAPSAARDRDNAWPELPPGRADAPAAAQVVAAQVVAAQAAAARPRADGLALGELFLRADSTMRQELLVTLDEQRSGTKSPPLRIPAGTLERLEAAALARDAGEFARLLQHGLGIPGRVAARIVADEFGEPLLLVAKILAVPPKVLARIFLFLNPQIGESVTRFFTLVNAYEDVSLRAAQQIVASWREVAAHAVPTSRYQPVHAPDAEAGSVAARSSARGGTAAPASTARERPADLRTGLRQEKR